MKKEYHTKYRPDIDGLRAIAIISVVIFHAFPKLIPGGFIGVDIFFVISGYLISTIILDNLQNNSFSYIDFYKRRIRRIFPALALVLTTCFVVGWFTLVADEFKQLSKHIFMGSIFLSNLALYGESGYFDNASETKPLLHLWSLSVEEQFYIFWPLALILLWKFKSNIFIAIIAIIAFSFALNAYFCHSNIVIDFYSPFTRFWELLCGALIAYIDFVYRKAPMAKSDVLIIKIKTFIEQHHNFRILLSLFALILLIVGMGAYQKSIPFPGFWALMPVCSAAILIFVGMRSPINAKIISSPILVWFGIISYPLYLWHWPLLSFAKIYYVDITDNIKIVIVILSVLLAWLTYKFIEKPLRFGKFANAKTILLIIIMIIIGFFGFNTYQRGGLSYREAVKLNSPPPQSGLLKEAPTINECSINDLSIKNRFRMCKSDSREKPKFALYGDSKAEALNHGLFSASNKGYRWLFIGGTANQSDAPLPALSDDELLTPSDTLSSVASDTICKNSDIEVVAITNSTRSLFHYNGSEFEYTQESYDKALHYFNNLITKFLRCKKQVVLVVDNPTFPDPKECIYRTTSLEFANAVIPKGKIKSECYLTLERHLKITKKYREMLEEIAKRRPNDVKVFDTTKYLCDTEHNECLRYKDGHSLYKYTDHISDYASELIAPDLNAYMQDMIKR